MSAPAIKLAELTSITRDTEIVLAQVVPGIMITNPQVIITNFNKLQPIVVTTFMVDETFKQKHMIVIDQELDSNEQYIIRLGCTLEPGSKVIVKSTSDNTAFVLIGDPMPARYAHK